MNTNLIEKIGSKYIIRNIFTYLQKDYIYELVKFDEEMENLLNLNEIYIEPGSNLKGIFINIPKEIDKYFHIYFDGEIADKKRNYLKKKK